MCDLSGEKDASLGLTMKVARLQKFAAHQKKKEKTKKTTTMIFMTKMG